MIKKKSTSTYSRLNKFHAMSIFKAIKQHIFLRNRSTVHFRSSIFVQIPTNSSQSNLIDWSENKMNLWIVLRVSWIHQMRNCSARFMNSPNAQENCPAHFMNSPNAQWMVARLVNSWNAQDNPWIVLRISWICWARFMDRHNPWIVLRVSWIHHHIFSIRCKWTPTAL